MRTAETAKVRTSDSGMEYSTPSSPKNRGSSSREAHAEHDLAQHRQEVRRQRPAHSLQEDEARLIDARQHQHAQVHAERLDGKIGIVRALVRRAEDGDELPREALGQHQRRRAHHAPAEAEDKDRVEDDVEHRAEQRADHGESRAAVGPDDGVHRLPEHIDRHAERDVEKILLRIAERLVVHRAAEHSDDRVGKQQIHRREHHARRDAEHHGVGNAAPGGVRLPAAKVDAHKGAAAVADHHRQRQRHDRERKDDGVGRVSERAEVVGVRDEELVDDVIQRADQQRDDAGHGIAPHERADALGPQKLIVCVHMGSSPCKKIGVSPKNLDLRIPAARSPCELVPKKARRFRQPDLRKNATRYGDIIPKRGENCKWFLQVWEIAKSKYFVVM